jgi:tetratricopeptide (TPR) repeat protein
MAAHYRVLFGFLLARLTGSMGAIEQELMLNAEREPDIFLYQLGVSWADRIRGERSGAQKLLTRVVRNRLKDVRRDAFQVLALCGLAELAFVEGRDDAAVILLREMRQYEKQFVVMSWGVACDGAIDHYLALLTTTLRRWTEAEVLFERALVMNAELGATPFVARTQHFYAEMLLRKGTVTDRTRAKELLEEAIGTYRRLSMDRYLEDAQHLVSDERRKAVRGEECAEGESFPDRSRERGEAFGKSDSLLTVDVEGMVRSGMGDTERKPANIFRREGDYWTLAFEGTVSRFKDKRGLQYLAYLLANPFKQVHSLDLATGLGTKREGTTAGSSTDSSVGEGLQARPLGDLGPALDAKARNDYKRRLAELKEELEQAEAFHDLGRVTILRRELDELTSYLTAASRPGRGSRLGGSYSERARVSVRNNIVTAVRTIRTHNDALGRHLSNAVRTGTFCSYTPERKIRWDF